LPSDASHESNHLFNHSGGSNRDVARMLDRVATYTSPIASHNLAPTSALRTSGHGTGADAVHLREADAVHLRECCALSSLPAMAPQLSTRAARRSLDAHSGTCGPDDIPGGHTGTLNSAPETALTTQARKIMHNGGLWNSGSTLRYHASLSAGIIPLASRPASTAVGTESPRASEHAHVRDERSKTASACANTQSR
jgi:hypothetical protein